MHSYVLGLPSRACGHRFTWKHTYDNSIPQLTIAMPLLYCRSSPNRTCIHHRFSGMLSCNSGTGTGKTNKVSKRDRGTLLDHERDLLFHFSEKRVPPTRQLTLQGEGAPSLHTITLVRFETNPRRSKFWTSPEKCSPPLDPARTPARPHALLHS